MKIKNKYKILIYIIIGLALAIRLAYIIKMPYTEKQHDVEPNGNGLSYIFTIYETFECYILLNGNMFLSMFRCLAVTWLRGCKVLTIKQLGIQVHNALRINQL